MQTRITSVSRLTDKQTGETLNQFVVYTNSREIPSLRMGKDGLKDVTSNAFKVFDSYLESCVFDAISELKEGRIYADLLNVAIDTDSIICLLLANATVEVDFAKVDSLCQQNTLGYYYRYDINNIQLCVDEYTKATLFEMYRRVFADKSEAYLRFIAQMLGVEAIFFG